MTSHSVIKKMEDMETQEELTEAFELFDRDGNGLISHAELMSAMNDMGEKLTNAEVADIIRQADMDGDGHINYDEFVNMMMVR